MRLSAMSLFAAMVTALPTSAMAQKGFLDFADPCKKAEAQYKTTDAAFDGAIQEGTARLKSWHDDPNKVPDKVLDHYRDAVKAYVFTTWNTSEEGQGVIKSWGLKPDDADGISKKFMEFIYPAKVKPDLEKSLAQEVFKGDYEKRLKPELDKEIAAQRKTLNENKKKLDEACSPDVFSQLLRASIGNLITMVGDNWKAAKNEKGEIAMAIRGLTGISVTDILKHGLAGGENSELNKLRRSWTDTLDAAGIGKNNDLRKFARAIDPTTLPMPKQLQFKIDGDSGKNLIKNLTLGGIK